MELEAVFEDHVLMRLDMTFANHSNLVIRNLGAFYNARAFSYENESPLALPSLAARLNRTPTSLDSSHAFERKPLEAISAGRVMEDGWLLAPKEEYKHSIVIPVSCEVGIVSLSANILYKVHRARSNSDLMVTWRATEEGIWYRIYEQDEGGGRMFVDELGRLLDEEIEMLIGEIEGRIEGLAQSGTPDDYDALYKKLVAVTNDLSGRFEEFVSISDIMIKTRLDNRLSANIKTLARQLGEGQDSIEGSGLRGSIDRIREVFDDLRLVVEENLKAHGIHYSVAVHEIAMPVLQTDERKCFIEGTGAEGE